MEEANTQPVPLQGRKLFRLIPLPVLNKQPAPAQSEEVSIQVFDSVGWVDRRLLWVFEIVSSLAVILLAIGLVTSQTNVQTHGAILTDNVTAQYAWAWTQNIAIDMSLLGAIIRACVYVMEREWKKAVLYAVLAGLLLFTAFIVSDVEAMYQSLQNVTIDGAWSKLPVSIEALTSIRSFAVVLLLVAHATQYVGWYHAKYQQRKNALQTLTKQDQAPLQGPIEEQTQPAQSDIDKLIAAMAEMNRQTLASMQQMNQQTMQVTIEQATRVTVEAMKQSLGELPFNQPLQIPVDAASKASVPPFARDYKSEIEALLLINPAITVDEVIAQTNCSEPTAKKWLEKLAKSA